MSDQSPSSPSPTPGPPPPPPVETELAPPTPVEAHAIQPSVVADLARMTPEQQDAAVETLERAAKLSLRLVKASCLATFGHDWIEHTGSGGGEPSLYLEGEGALRMARPLGLKISAAKFSMEKIEGHYFVECEVTATWPAMNAAVCERGTCDTFDKFWTVGDHSVYKRYLARADGSEAIARRMMLGDIRKKAHMNAISRAVTGVTGTRGIKKSDLASYGFPVDEIGQVKHKTSGKQTSRTSAATGKKETTESFKLLTVYQLTDLPIGSTCSVTAKVLSVAHSKTAKGVPYATFSVQDPDGDVSAWIRVWSNLENEPWAAVGAMVHFPKVEVGDFQGRDYSSKTAEAAEPMG